jgi:hypothetical protein
MTSYLTNSLHQFSCQAVMSCPWLARLEPQWSVFNGCVTETSMCEMVSRVIRKFVQFRASSSKYKDPIRVHSLATAMVLVRLFLAGGRVVWISTVIRGYPDESEVSAHLNQPHFHLSHSCWGQSQHCRLISRHHTLWCHLHDSLHIHS